MRKFYRADGRELLFGDDDFSLEISTVHVDIGFAGPTGAPQVDLLGAAGPGGPGAMAAGGKKGGGSTSGGGTAGGSTTGGGTTGGTTDTTGTGTGTTTIFRDVTTLWQALNPPNSDSGTPTDTLLSKEWNLTNSKYGINVLQTWQDYSGLGIRVGVIDDGFDYRHSDLNQHYLYNLDYDATNGGGDAFGTASDRHGTTVMGVIGAERDGTGIVGVAYNAGMAGFRIGFGASGSASQNASAFSHALSSGMDVINASWGYSTAFQDNFYSSTYASSEIAIQNDITNGRGGLGINIVFAAGNGRTTGDNVNYHNYINDQNVIVVAATGTLGYVASYSTPGAAVLVSAPGGSSIQTVDRLGSDGYSTTDYTVMSGTSYAAPAVSGVIALMLEANPDLGYRDVMEILAYSAKNSDPASSGWQTNGAPNWNGGGLHFSHDYGFGLVDATAAVRLAESWQKQSTYANLSTQSVVHTDNLKIPDGSGSLQSTIALNSSEWIDRIVVDLNITHAKPSDLTVTLTSPDGTTAVLVAHPTNGTGSGIVFETTANNFWGENAKGDWTLTVSDTVGGNIGTLNGWTLQALGDAPNTPTTYIYTDEFATAAGAERTLLNDSSGTAGINTAAVTSGSLLDLHAGAIDVIAGRSVQIGSGTIIKTAWAGDGNDTIIANDYGNMIQGGRGNDMIVAGGGVDLLSGGPGSDLFVFNSLGQLGDRIVDFSAGDVIDLRGILAAIGYAGTDPLAEGWVILAASASGGTDLLVDAHNGQSTATVIEILGMQPTTLYLGANWCLTG